MADYRFVKSYEQRRLNKFWSTFPKFHIDHWCQLLEDEQNMFSNFKYEKAIEMLKNALKKMHVEKLIAEDELYNLLKMLDSPDIENNYVVLSVMKRLKKTKFKK